MQIALLTLLSTLLVASSFATSQPVRYVEPAKHTKVRDCTRLIRASYDPKYDWGGSEALSLAECLIRAKPKHDTCVFYTSDSKLNAIRYAFETNKTTIYDVYAPHHFDTSVEPMKRWKKDGHQRDLFRITSKAYALACSGRASVVMPENEEACPGSIWVTDEYEVIRNGESRIELPVWRVSWVEDKLKGVWNWVTRILGGDVEKRGLFGDAQVVISDVTDDVRAKIGRKMDVLKEMWGLSDGTAENDPWAVSRGQCGR